MSPPPFSSGNIPCQKQHRHLSGETAYLDFGSSVLSRLISRLWCHGGMTRNPYKTDLINAEWELIKPLIPLPKPGGRPRTVEMREILNAIFYLVRTGCAWEMLPHDFPPPSTVYFYFRRWQKKGHNETGLNGQTFIHLPYRVR